MSILRGALGLGRRAAEARMTETVQVGVVVAHTDPLSGDVVDAVASPRYSGKGRISYGAYSVSDEAGAGQVFSSQKLFLSIPAGSAACFEGDTVIVSTSVVDGALVGRRFRVDGAAAVGQTTAHRYPLSELS